MKTELKVEGMSCGHCVAGVRGALEAIEGVTSAEVSLSEGKAIVEHEPTVDLESLVTAVEEEGYTAKAA